MKYIVSTASEDKESCGFLAGYIREGGVYEADEAFFVKNVSNDPHSFTMDPLETVRTIKEIERKGKSVVAVFHTHLGYPPVPSISDLEGMDAWPIPWLIIDKRSGEYKTWIRRDGKLDLVETEITPDH